MSRLSEMIKELCPDGVEYRWFEDCCEYVRGITYNKSNEARNDSEPVWRVLRANNITLSSNTLNFDDVKLIEKTVRVKEDQFLTKGDILICAGSGSKEHIGKVAYIDENMEYTFGGFMAVIRCNSSIDSRYLFHIFTSKLFLSYLDTALNSSTINNLNFSVMKKFIFPVPPLPIQNEIVKLLDNFTELTAELTAELVLRKKQYNFYRDGLLKFPSNTKRYKTGDIFNIQNGYTPSKKQSSYWEHGTIPWYRMEDIRANGRILYDAIQHVHYSGVKGNLYPEKSILMATTATIGEYALLMTSSLSNQQMTNFSIKKEFKELLDVKFAFYYFHVFAEWCKKNANQSGGMPIITSAKLKTFSFPIPPLEAQQKIVSILDRFDTLCNDLTQGLPAEIAARKKQYEYYRDKLLTFPRKAV